MVKKLVRKRNRQRQQQQNYWGNGNDGDGYDGDYGGLQGDPVTSLEQSLLNPTSPIGFVWHGIKYIACRIYKVLQTIVNAIANMSTKQLRNYVGITHFLVFAVNIVVLIWYAWGTPTSPIIVDALSITSTTTTTVRTTVPVALLPSWTSSSSFSSSASFSRLCSDTPRRNQHRRPHLSTLILSSSSSTTTTTMSAVDASTSTETTMKKEGINVPSSSAISDSKMNNDNTTIANTPLTNAVIRVSYDGTKFTGWASNGQETTLTDSQKRRRRRRSPNRGIRGEGIYVDDDSVTTKKGFTRSVEYTLMLNLAKVYGNVPPHRVVVEGCSRTDKGVHATSMIAHIYCLSSTEDGDEAGHVGTSATTRSAVIPGKRKPHPTSSTDNVSGLLEVVPWNGNLSRLAFALNRMRPADLQITGIAPTPTIPDGGVFHASTSSIAKTYEYRISTGQIYDPTRRRYVWHTQRQPLDYESMKDACQILKGKHDFSAFQGTPRGSEDRKKRQEANKDNEDGGDGQPTQDTICHLYEVDIVQEIIDQSTIYFDGVDPPIRNYRLVFKGDRFLYKMVRFLVGAIVAVGSNKIQLDDIEKALEHGNWDITLTQEDHEDGMKQRRRHEFECAPPHGLVLTNIDYGPDVVFDWQPLRDVQMV